MFAILLRIGQPSAVRTRIGIVASIMHRNREHAGTSRRRWGTARILADFGGSGPGEPKPFNELVGSQSMPTRTSARLSRSGAASYLFL
jgi:hypothetical protein